MENPVSLTKNPSRLFVGNVGEIYPYERMDGNNFFIDDARYDSDGGWAFCVLDGDEIYAARLGFQKGGFNISNRNLRPAKGMLQFHLELVTREGCIIWIPMGIYNTESLAITREPYSLKSLSEGQEIFSISGLSDMRWHFRSAEGDAEAEINFHVTHLTLLQDCILPFCTFAMWESVSDVTGRIHYKDKTAVVKGKVFYDHPRIVNAPTGAAARKSYIYITINLEDGSSFYCYYAEDEKGNPFPYYCFGTYIDSDSRHIFSTVTDLLDAGYDGNHLPLYWKLAWAGGTYKMNFDISVKHLTC